MQALKIATIIFNIAMLLWMIVLDCKEKNTGTSVGFKILSLGFGGTIVYLIMNQQKGKGDEMKKKKINDGLRNLPKNFVTENELEENIKTEIAKEITNTRKR